MSNGNGASRVNRPNKGLPDTPGNHAADYGAHKSMTQNATKKDPEPTLGGITVPGGNLHNVLSNSQVKHMANGALSSDSSTGCLPSSNNT